MAANTVQFVGIANVLKMFEYKGVQVWSIWQARQLIHKGMGSDELDEFLRMLQAGGSVATYTLQVYEDIDNASLVKSNTPHTGSINFKLAEDYQTGQSSFNVLASEIAGIKRQLEDGGSSEKVPKSKLGVIGEILDLPIMEQVAPMVIARILDYVLPKAQLPAMPQHQYPGPEKVSSISGIEDPQLNEALQILRQQDSKLTEHLLKLAKLSIENPQSFKFLLSTLDQM